MVWVIRLDRALKESTYHSLVNTHCKSEMVCCSTDSRGDTIMTTSKHTGNMLPHHKLCHDFQVTAAQCNLSRICVLSTHQALSTRLTLTANIQCCSYTFLIPSLVAAYCTSIVTKKILSIDMSMFWRKYTVQIISDMPLSAIVYGYWLITTN